MRKLIQLFVFLSLVLLFGVAACAQRVLFAEYTYGQYLSHTDNDVELTNESDLKHIFGFHAGFQFTFKDKHILQFQVGFNRCNEEKVTSFLNYYEDPWDQGYVEKPIDLTFYTIPLDILYMLPLGGYFNLGIGPSFAGSIRDITVHYINWESEKKTFIDRLFSFGIGAGGLLQLSIPLRKKSNICFISDVRLRYIRTIVYDKNGRDVSDYNQQYLQAQVSAGLGFGF